MAISLIKYKTPQFFVASLSLIVNWIRSDIFLVYKVKDEVKSELTSWKMNMNG